MKSPKLSDDTEPDHLKPKKPSRGVKGMDRTVTQPGHSEIASSASYYQCTQTSNKR